MGASGSADKLDASYNAPMHRIPFEELSIDLQTDAELSLTGPQVRHLHVLRLAAGETVQVFDGSGKQAQAVLLSLDEQRATLRLLEPPTSDLSREYPQQVTLAVALLKGDKLADVVRASTELGASCIQLLSTKHADVPSIGQQKLTRLRRIASEAARQSGRAVTPTVLEPLPLTSYQPVGRILLAHTGSTAQLAQVLQWDKPITLLTGPEGGFASSEVNSLLAAGATAITLGPRILRAETAPVALLGALAATGR